MKKYSLFASAWLLLISCTPSANNGSTASQQTSSQIAMSDESTSPSATSSDYGKDNAEKDGKDSELLEIPVLTKKRPEILIRHYSYTVSYNPDLCIPNWVAWQLDSDKLVERESRNKHFEPDPNLPSNKAVTTDEYKRSGWDRGHMCPAGDNKYHWRAMDASFYMTNVCPQNSNLNRGDWKELEDACRVWAATEPVYIVCGPILYKQPKYGYIGKNFQIRIPDAFFKVILTGISSGKPRAIGFVYKNESGNNPRDKYMNTIDEVERMVSMDFFSALPDEIENKIESEYNTKDWR